MAVHDLIKQSENPASLLDIPLYWDAAATSSTSRSSFNNTETNLHPWRCAEQAGWSPGDTGRVSWEREWFEHNISPAAGGKSSTAACLSRLLQAQAAGHKAGATRFSEFCQVTRQEPCAQMLSSCAHIPHPKQGTAGALHMKSCNVGTQLPKSRPPPASSLQV